MPPLRYAKGCGADLGWGASGKDEEEAGMLDTLLRHHTLIRTAIFVITTVLIFRVLELSWYFTLPLALFAGLLATVAWGLFLGLMEQPRYLFF